jgi:hypothetical protein
VSPYIFTLLNDLASDFEFLLANGHIKRANIKNTIESELNEFYRMIERKTQNRVIMPESLWKIMWDSILLIMTTFNLCYITFRFAFPIEMYDQDFGMF